MFQLLLSSYCGLTGVNVCLGVLGKPPLNHKKKKKMMNWHD